MNTKEVTLKNGWTCVIKPMSPRQLQLAERNLTNDGFRSASVTDWNVELSGEVARLVLVSAVTKKGENPIAGLKPRDIRNLFLDAPGNLPDAIATEARTFGNELFEAQAADAGN